jgi:hypothetical protein
MIRAALLRHYGETLQPELDRGQAWELTVALDKLKLQLLDIRTSLSRRWANEAINVYGLG